MESLVKSLSPELVKKCKKTKQPAFVQPMLATLTKKYFSNSDWLYEHKFDGERCVIVKRKGKVSLLSRNRNLINNAYPELVHALEQQRADNFIIDGEIIAKDKQGLSSFEMLQPRINLKALSAIQEKSINTPIFLCIFDCMYMDGYDIRNVPLLERKKLLRKLLSFTTMLLYTEHTTYDGLMLFKQACASRWEGLIVKKADSLYVGKRSPLWLKFKCSMGQELVIGGYTKPQGSRTDFGALLVGYYKDGALCYAGKVGTGFSYEVLVLLGKKLRALETTKSPFVDYESSLSTVHWVKPQLVADFEFAQWTSQGRLRVGRYKGLRDDKAAKKVIRETPAD